MSAESDIRAAIRSIAGIENIATSILCKVVSIDEDEFTCEVKPIDDGANYKDVRLISDASDPDKAFYLKPVVGSVVMITPQDDVTYFVSMYSQVEEIWLHGNLNEGLVKVVELTEKLNNIENLVNDLITKFNAHTHVLTLSAGTGTAAPTTSLETDTLTPTEQADIENDKVKHG